MRKRNEKALIELLNTGVEGLDVVLGGGIPEYSFNIVSGTPGTWAKPCISST